MRIFKMALQKTYSAKPQDIIHKWYLIDAEKLILGRLAVIVANRLRGKHKVNFSPHMDMGDFVIIINAEKIKVTGNKETDKTYFKHSGYPGGGSEISLAELRRSKPERILESAIKGMLPHNRLGRKLLKHLKVYSGPDHPHESQQPKPLNF